jgi:hypothetical protein
MTSKAPNRIWATPTIVKGHDGVDWQFGEWADAWYEKSEVKYIRADIHKAELAALQSQLEAARRVKPATMDIDLIAKAIGHHFWECASDDSAISAGMDAARDVISALGGDA